MNDIYTNDPIAEKRSSGNTRLKIFLSFGLTLALFLAALGAAAVFYSFNNETRYFTASPITLALAITSAITVALAISAFFVFKGAKLEQSNTHVGTSRCTRLLSVVFMATCAHYVISTINTSTDSAEAKSHAYTAILLFLMFVLCAVYEISHVMALNKTLTVISGFARIVFCLYIVSTLYFDMHVEINSPFKLVVQFAAAALAIDTCMEVRDIISGVSTRAYIAAKTLSISIAALTLAISACAIIKNAKFEDLGYLWYSLYFISLAICSCIDLARIKYPTSIMIELESESESESEPKLELDPELKVELGLESQFLAETEADRPSDQQNT